MPWWDLLGSVLDAVPYRVLLAKTENPCAMSEYLKIPGESRHGAVDPSHFVLWRYQGTNRLVPPGSLDSTARNGPRTFLQWPPVLVGYTSER